MFSAFSAVQGTGSPQPALTTTVLRMLALKLLPDNKRQDVTTLLGLLRDGAITSQAATVLPLREARHAEELLETAKVTGKIILQP